MITVRPDIENRFIGIPYELGGRSFKGSDCMGVILLWLKENGIKYEYSERETLKMKKFWETSPGKFADMVAKYGKMIPFPYVRKFDFLFFYADGESVFPTLPAVMVDDRHFLIVRQAHVGSEVLMLSKEWKTRFWGAIKLKKAVEKGVR